MGEGLGTAEVARATGYSVQQVRDLEAAGVLAPADRRANGYRRFSSGHVRDLSTYRELATAVGPVAARATMRDVRQLPADEAVALVGALHRRLGDERAEVLAALRALRVIDAERDGTDEPEDAMTIRELAGALNVRSSTLRYWEQCGLVSPERIPTPAGTARHYPAHAVREARITAALRGAGYRIPEVRAAIVALREYRDVADPLDVLRARLGDVARRQLALLRAGAALAEVVAGGASS